LERGERTLDSLKLIVALARALEIAPSELTGLPVPAPGNGHTDSATERVRHALTAVDVGHPGGLVVPVDVLRDRAARLQDARRRCRFAEVADDLPGLIRDLHTSINAGGHDVAELFPLAAFVHADIVSKWLQDAGAPELRWQAATVARNAAAEHGETTTLGVAAFGTAWALVSGGMLDLAQAELDSATFPPTTPETAGLVCALTMMHAVVAAADNRPGDVAAPMESAAELAQRFGQPGEDSPLGFAVGPADVGFRGIALALDAGEPDRAVAIAEGVRPEQLSFVTRQAGYWVDFGRAAARLRDRRDDAVRAFLAVEELFPVRVYRNPLARETIAGLVQRSRSDAVGRDLRGLASRAGLL
ncbi:MAG: XRE family transcriptional regulator, partial [Pseudonocardiaceae bacterium]